jgi:coniferyl-aldehyde dehydrogenase
MHEDKVEDSSIANLERRFRAMQAASRSEPPSSAAERKAHLRALRDMLSASTSQFVDAICRDYGWRSHDETRMAEIVPALANVSDALHNVAAWMGPERRGVAVQFWPGRNKVYWQPKGVVLIVSPWNYPLQLAVGPLVAALAAGNRVILKPSEATPATSAALKRNLEAALGSDRVTVATGGTELAAALCRLPFDHILFTGSTAVGRKVMQAAAENLTPVTLELGGKSPAIVHQDCDLAVAAARIARGKLMNAGQTCIAPDYALVPRPRVDEFVRLFQDAAATLYPRLVDNRDYTAIINARHYDRLVGLVNDARAKGAQILTIDPAHELPSGEIGSSNTRKIAPVVLTGVTDAMMVMSEEIFGPLLPVVPYATVDEAIAYVNARPRPLALYYFDSDRWRIEQVLHRTVSGGATIITTATPQTLIRQALTSRRVTGSPRLRRSRWRRQASTRSPQPRGSIESPIRQRPFQHSSLLRAHLRLADRFFCCSRPF